MSMPKERNEELTRTGPGTLMGDLVRRYWIPALLATELPGPDCPPVLVTLLSEPLVAFRDTQGRYGLIDEFCAHRGVSLWFGRNEQSGLRCAYHGWKYDVTGQCIEVPPEQRFVSKRWQESNWLQALEGGIDSTHVSFLHRSDLEADPLFKGAKGNRYNLSDAQPCFEVVESVGGLLIGARRNAENGHYYWRITQWVMPCFTMIPPRGDHPVHGHFFIPIDDENCWAWSYDFHPTRAITETERNAMRDGQGIHVKYVAGTFRPLANKDNDYLMDRAAQRAGKTYSGVEGFAMQDASLQESMGPIVDRTKENLVSTDNGIIMARRRLMRSAKDLIEQGTAPPGVDPAHQRVRSASVLLRPDQPFATAVPEALAASSRAHASV